MALEAVRRQEEEMAKEMLGVVPMLAYENGVAALEWLARAFGFHEEMRMTAPDGTLTHGEMETGDGVIMLGTPTPDYEGPRRHRERCERARLWSAVPWIIDGVLVHVEDANQHHQRAQREGATILSAPEAGPGGRMYRAEDVEGHRWMFLERQKR
jgi:uncharacterized glyoxalase superfamily protein PhnB